MLFELYLGKGTGYGLAARHGIPHVAHVLLQARDRRDGEVEVLGHVRGGFVPASCTSIRW